MDSDASAVPTLEQIEAARARIAGQVHLTPVMTSATLDAHAGARLYFKCENLQKVGAFKARGASNAVLALGAAQARHGVATHSSGNHAAALARAARLRGIRAQIVMPRTAPRVKQESVRRYGGEITFCEPTLADRERTLAALVQQSKAHVVHPYDDLQVMAGQATTALELLEQAPIEVLLAPIGGGGLLGGMALAVRALAPAVRVLGVEPELADDARRSLAAGHIIPSGDPPTIADGLRGTLAPRTFAALRSAVDGVLTVSEAQIVAAMRSLFEVMKMVVEPSGAVACAAALALPPQFAGRRVGVVLTGGNLDPEHLPWQRQSCDRRE